MAQQYGLGRGLASLIPPKKKMTEEAAQASPFSAPRDDTMTPKSKSFASDNGPSHSAREIPIESIVPNPHQPRLHFDETKLDELVQSIKEHGILQPLVVSESGAGAYELIAGERRLQAARRAGLSVVPIVVRSVDEREKLELAIIENIQRHNLNPIEEAKAYARLTNEFGLQQDAVAKKMGKSRSAVANTLRLLHLPVEIQRAVAEGRISEGHAKALLAIENSEKQRAVFDLIIKEELTVRETEMKVRFITVSPHTRSVAAVSPEIAERAERLMQTLGTKVKITPSGKGGKIVIEYYSPEELEGLLKKMGESGQ